MEKDTKNRIFKFRGKQICDGILKFGNLIIYSETDYEIEWFCDIDKRWYRSKVVPETVGQFTGLRDKNGKEIYEGDILKYGRDGRLYVVTFFDGMFYASVEEFNEYLYGGFPLYALTNEEDKYKCEVIGNIFDSKQLKGEQQ